jgi:hypothetical protein
MISARHLRRPLADQFVLSGNARAWLGIALFGILGLVLVVAPEVTHGRMPGDAVDSRFNDYILEHGYLWLTGRAASFWNAEFFYPFPLTIAFSDNHLGNGFIYSALRLLGYDREDAYRGWYLFGFAINFTACACSLRRLGHGWLAAALGAFLFTFALPMTAQSGHNQLNYRFGVPLAMLALVQFELRPRLLTLLAVGFWTVWQFYCSIYLGYFLSLLLGAFALTSALTRTPLGLATLLYWPSRIIYAWQDASGRACTGFLLGGVILCALMAALLAPYFTVSQSYAFRHSWDEIASMLPRPSSYLLTNNSRLWRFSWRGFDALPLRWEHAMFVGVAPLLAIVIALTLRWLKRAVLGSRFSATVLAIGFLVGLTLWIGGHSLYAVVAELPGADAIRAVTRIGLVMLFPVSMLFAMSVDALSTARVPATVLYTGPVLIAGLLVLECSDIKHYTSLKREWDDRLRMAAAELPADLPPSPILLLAPRLNEDPNLREVDGMLLAQERGWATINGYSGNVPPGHVLTGDCPDAASDLSTALDFLRRPGNEEFERLAKRVVRVGYVDCDPSWVSRHGRRTTFDGRLPVELMAATTISIDNIRISNGAPVVTVVISNLGNVPIPALSGSDMPMHISARYFPVAGLTPEALRTNGWDFRRPLDADVPAGGAMRMDVAMPVPPVGGPYVVAVSLVQERVAWFHDNGMPIAVSKQKILMEPPYLAN